MSKERVPKVNELIKQELGSILLREIDFPKDLLVTITKTETSSNMIQCKVYLSVMPENKSEEVLKTINQNIFDVQQALNKRLRMRPTPKIKFIEEKSVREAGRVDKILEELKKGK